MLIGFERKNIAFHWLTSGGLMKNTDGPLPLSVRDLLCRFRKQIINSVNRVTFVKYL